METVTPPGEGEERVDGAYVSLRENENAGNPPDEEIPGLPLFCELPLLHAAHAMALCDPNLKEKEKVEQIFEGMQANCVEEEFYDMYRAESVLVLQARVLDTVFNRFLQRAGLREMEGLNTYRLEKALQAQRQCRQTIETLKKAQFWTKKTKNFNNGLRGWR